MSSEFLVVTISLVLLLLVIVIPGRHRNRCVFESRHVAREDDGAIVIRRGREGLAFTMVVFFVLGMMGLTASGVPRFALCAICVAGVLGTGLAYGHKLILSGERLTVMTWRRFEVSRRDITSYHVERSEDDGRVIWIDVRSGSRRCKLGQDMVNSSEQESALLSFLAAARD